MVQQFDFLVIGSGIAGMSLALKVADKGKVAIICKTELEEANTYFAQGGIASVTNLLVDNFDKHIEDTMIAGDWINDREAVEMVVRGAPDQIKELISWGVNFDKKENGEFDLHREGGHSEFRILHHKDNTGAEIQDSLIKAVQRHPNIEVIENQFAVEILTQHHLGVTVSWSINTLDENFKNDMDSASSIERRIAAMKQVYDAGIRTVCFVSPVFPGITDFEAIFERVKDQCDLFWLENLNLRGGFKKTIMDYIAGKHPDLVPLYDEIYNKHNRSYFEALEVKAEKMAKKYDCAFVDNEMPYGRVPQGHPVIVDYFYHEEIRGTENTGKRNR